MQIASKGLMPRLTPMLRLALALASLFFLLPLLIILGAYGIGPVTVTDGAPSGGMLIVGVVVGGIFIALLGLAITGWNPFHRVDVAMAKMRAEAEAAAIHAPKPSLGQRVGAIVVIGAVVYLLHWLASQGMIRAVRALFE
jgi:ABC-type protease/lipase transport system fused ATPase/permease subunit